MLIHAGALGNRRGWETVALAGLDIVALPGLPSPPRGQHLTAPPYVAPLAQALRDL